MAILSVLALSITVARTNQESVDQSVGNLVATQILDGLVDELRAAPPSGRKSNFLNNDHTTSPFDSGQITNNGTEYEYEIFTMNITKADGSVLGEDVNRRLKKVDVIISWWDSKDTQRQGYGKLQFAQTRLIGEAEL